MDPYQAHEGRKSSPIPNATNSKQKSPAAAIPGRSHFEVSRHTMDPFEVRIRFTQYLQHLNASVTSANKTAQYALKYRDMDEDLHSCILEQLERVSGHFGIYLLFQMDLRLGERLALYCGTKSNAGKLLIASSFARVKLIHNRIR
jgi:hypothetical protein